MSNGEEPPIETTAGGGTPLRRFKAELQDYTFEERDGTWGKYKWVSFDFVEVEVVEAVAPYPFPIAKLGLKWSGTTETAWGRLMESFKRLFPEASNLQPLKGKRQEWAMLPASVTKKDDETGKFGAVEESVWQIVGVEGTTIEDLNEKLLCLADGKCEVDYYTALISDPKVMKRPDLVTQIVDRKLLPAYLETKLLSRDAEGVLHKA